MGSEDKTEGASRPVQDSKLDLSTFSKAAKHPEKRSRRLAKPGRRPTALDGESVNHHYGRTLRPVATLALMLAIAGPAAAAQELQLIPDLRMLVILVVVFALLIIPVNALLFKPLFQVIDERDQKIRGARARAAALEAEAEASLARYREAVAEVRADSERQRRASLDEARSEQARVLSGVRVEVDRELERARGELASSRAKAAATLQESSQDLARAAAEQILGRSLS